MSACPADILAQLKVPDGYRAVFDADGGISIVAVAPAVSALGSAQAWIAARSVETSTHLGAGVIGVGYMAMGNQIMSMVTQAASGDYLGAAVSAVPIAVAAASALAAIITPTPKGPTDEEIHIAVSRMSRDELMGLLNTPDKVLTTHAPA